MRKHLRALGKRTAQLMDSIPQNTPEIDPEALSKLMQQIQGAYELTETNEQLRRELTETKAKVQNQSKNYVELTFNYRDYMVLVGIMMLRTNDDTVEINGIVIDMSDVEWDDTEDKVLVVAKGMKDSFYATSKAIFFQVLS